MQVLYLIIYMKRFPDKLLVKGEGSITLTPDITCGVSEAGPFPIVQFLLLTN